MKETFNKHFHSIHKVGGETRTGHWFWNLPRSAGHSDAFSLTVCGGGHTTVHPDRDGNQSATPKSFFIFTFRLKISVSSRHEIPPFFKLVSIHPCDENLLSADTVPDVRPSLKIFHIPYLRKKST